MPHHSVGRWTWRAFLFLVMAVVLWYGAVHVLPQARSSWTSAGGGRPWALAAALVLELGSLACYSGLTRALLPGTDRPAYGTILAADLTGNGVSRVVPGGGATAAAARLGLFVDAGVERTEAVSATALEWAVSVLWLVVVLAAGAAIAVPSATTPSAVRVAAVVAFILVLLCAVLLATLMAEPDRIGDVAKSATRPLPFVSSDTVERAVRAVVDQVRGVLHDSQRRRLAIGWGLGNWALDAASLYLSVVAFGVTPPIGGALAAYAVGALLALLPLTPGGLGAVEGTVVPALVSFGVSGSAALLGVLAWRLFEFWLPIPLAAVGYGWLRLGRRREHHSPNARTR